MPLSEGVFTTLADSAARFGYTESCARLLNRLKPHIADRARWEELRVGLSTCYLDEGSSAAMQDLMQDANLSGMSDAAVAQIYYNNARLLEQNSRWNDALGYYRSVIRLGGTRAGDANFRCYAILKHVQDPLNLDLAEAYLSTVIKDYPGSEYFAKAVEELIPLQIFLGQDSNAQSVADYVLTLNPVEPEENWEGYVRALQLQEVALFWRAQLARRRGNETAAAENLAQIPLKFWNYYELTSNYPPDLSAYSEGAALLDEPETVGEYFAGTGMVSVADEYYSAQNEPASQLLEYLRLYWLGQVKELPSFQWHCTGALESGRISERALVDWVLPRAYPRPYTDEVGAAAAASGVDENLVYAIMKKESNFKPDAESWAGAQGLMQVMPQTARWLIDRYDLSVDYNRRTEPVQNIRLGAAFVRSISDQLDGKTRAMIHAYNGGVGNYKKWSGRYGEEPVMVTELIPNEENEGFGKRVTRYYKVYAWLAGRSADDG